MRNAVIALALLMGQIFGAISAVSVPHNPDTATTPRVRYVWQNDSTLQTKVNEIKDSVNLYSGGTLVSNSSLRATIDADNNATTEHFYITRNGSTDTVFKVAENIGSHSRFWSGLTIDSNMTVRKVSASDSVVGAHLKTVAGNLIVGGTGAITGALSSGAFSATTGNFSGAVSTGALTATTGTLSGNTSIAGHTSVGTTSFNLNSQTRELAVSGGVAGNVNAGLSLQGSSTTSSIFGQVNGFHQSNLAAVLGMYRDGADNRAGFDFYTHNGTSLASRLVLSSAGNLSAGGTLTVTGKITGSDSVVATSGLRVGSDANLNRSGTNMLNTPDSLTVQGRLEVTGPALTTGVHTFTAAPVFNSATASQFLLLDGSKALTSVAGSGSGSVVRATSPTITTPTFSGTIASGLTASRTLITDGSGNMSVNTETGTGSHVRASSPTLTTPNIGAATATSVTFGDEALSAYDEGTFTASLEGVNATVTGTAYYTKVGTLVTINFPSLLGTSDSTGCKIIGAPASLNPSRSNFVSIDEFRDNGLSYTGSLLIQPGASTPTFVPHIRTSLTAIPSSTFTASGQKGLGSGHTITYTLQ